MNASTKRTSTTNEDFAAELAESALQVAARHGASAVSVAAELELWRALAAAVRGASTPCGALCQATDIAYRTMLSHRPAGTFLDLELGIWKAFGERWGGRSAAGVPLAC
jgi:hypothetical protein